MNLNNDLNVVWRKEWVREYETPWSIFEKLSFANVIDRDSIIRILGNESIQNIKSKVIGDNRRELINLDAFDEDLLIKVLSYNLIENNKATITLLLHSLKHFRELPHTWFAKHVRWCAECLSSGFHSWFHQFILVQKCPYHGTKVIEKCPNCRKEIPFMISNKRLSNPFTCTCGYILADFSTKGWSEWDISFEISDPFILRWISRDVGDQLYFRWLFLPQHGSIELLTDSSLTSSLLIEPSDKNDGIVQTPDLIEQIYLENLTIFRSVDRHLKKTLFQKHSHCIKQFWEMRIADTKELPEICPYAYAYVFWRKSLLLSEYFYRRNTRGDDIEEPRRFEFSLQLATKIIYEEIQYLYKEFRRQAASHASAQQLIWILNKITAQFCINFFYAWFEVAEEGALRESAPTWKEITEIKQASFPKFALKIIDETNTLSIEYSIEYFLHEQSKQKIQDLECPNRSLKSKRKINRMKSFTPMNVAMNVFNNPTEENKQLRLIIDRFVSKLRF
ncbi:MAG: hypothetical protein ACQEXQ_18925 [Bacillota bacterium]